MADVEITTGDITKWADKMEQRGADFAAKVVKRVKRQKESDRRQHSHVRFAKIRRRNTGTKRFAIASKGTAAELITDATAKFTDIFKD